MSLKDLDHEFGAELAVHLSSSGFKGRGQLGARQWYRKVGDGIWQIVVTPCVPWRDGGGSIECGFGVRFDEIEDSLALLTEGAGCFCPNSKSTTIGATLAALQGPESSQIRGIITDRASVKSVVLGLAPLVTQVGIPWLERMTEYEAAYRASCERLERYEVCHCVDIARNYLLGKRLGLPLGRTAIDRCRRIIEAHEIGASVCQTILENKADE